MLSEVTLHYKIQIEKKGAESSEALLKIFLKGNQSRTEMISTLGTETSIYDHKTGKAVILREYSGQKLMITLTREEWEKRNEALSGAIFTSEAASRVQGQYQCIPAKASIGQGKTLTACYLPDTQLSNRQFNQALTNLPGLPVEFALESENLTYRYTLESMQLESISPARFEWPKTGYRVMRFSESGKVNP